MVGVFGVVGGFCGCVMGVMGLWFVFGGWGWVLFSFVAGTWFGSDRQGFLACVCWVWVVVVALGGWFFLVGFWSQALWVWVCGWGFSGVGLVSAPSDD